MSSVHMHVSNGEKWDTERQREPIQALGLLPFLLFFDFEIVRKLLTSWIRMLNLGLNTLWDAHFSWCTLKLRRWNNLLQGFKKHSKEKVRDNNSPRKPWSQSELIQCESNPMDMLRRDFIGRWFNWRWVWYQVWLRKCSFFTEHPGNVV